MKELTAFAKLLGEENEKRFKDEVINILINRVRDEVDAIEECVFDLDELVGEVMDEIEKDMKDKVYKICADRVMEGVQSFAFVKKTNEE